MAEWQPIETAPKDGTKILVNAGRQGMFVTWWVPHIAAKLGDRYGWHYTSNGWLAPLYWQPLPEPPNV
jgi:hypothetical protein